MERGTIIVGAVLGAIAGAVLAAYVQELWVSEPEGDDEIGRRLTELEAEIEELEFRLSEDKKRNGKSAPAPQFGQRPTTQPWPFPEVRGQAPAQQFLVFSGDRDFKLSRIDYVSDRGTTVISEDVEKTGTHIEVPINEKKISRVWYLLPRESEQPTQFRFVCHLKVDGVETQSVLPAVIHQSYMWRGPARTLFRNVTLTR